LLTTGNLFCGFLALILTTQRRFTEAAVAVLVAMVLDLLDGKVARLTKTTSQFGVEFDSLADVVSFCVAPAFMLYNLALAPLGRAAWLGAFLYVICGALRLARFNVYTGVVDRRYFVGLPTPAAAGMVVAVILLFDGEETLERWQAGAIAVGTYIVALLMVSTFRYWSFKEIDFARRRPVGLLLLVVLGVLIVATHPQWFLLRALLRLPAQRPHASPVGAPSRGRRAGGQGAPGRALTGRDADPEHPGETTRP
jgi:CDP-diacylglycerol--serine O-phosphatidyltransferase